MTVLVTLGEFTLNRVSDVLRLRFADVVNGTWYTVSANIPTDRPKQPPEQQEPVFGVSQGARLDSVEVRVISHEPIGTGADTGGVATDRETTSLLTRELPTFDNYIFSFRLVSSRRLFARLAHGSCTTIVINDDDTFAQPSTSVSHTTV